MFMLPPITSTRLVLRPFAESDRAARLQYQQRDDVARFLRRDPLTDETVMNGPRRNLEGRFDHDGDRLLYAVERVSDGVLIGEVSARMLSVHARQVELAWVFDPDAGGKGYATESVRALVADLFVRRGAHRLVARMDPRNEASARLCRRLGMRQEALLLENERQDGEWLSELVFAVLDREWAV